jgi:DNA polymerase-3 subunit delta'
MEDLTYPWVQPVIDRLPRSAKALPRALLLAGRPGLAKRATALFLVQGLLCETKRDGLKACGTCASCLLYKAGNHPDLRMIEVGHDDEEPTVEEDAGPAKKASRLISVERIRTLMDFVTITSHRGGAKVVCIVPAEAMHPGAANAVLKILEEPPGDTYFLLVSHQVERLLPTIRSRCFQLAFALPDAGPTLDWLKGQGIEQGELALAQGGYAPLAAIDRAGDETFWKQRKALLDALAAPGFDLLRAADCAEDIDGTLVSTLLSQWAYDVAALRSGGQVRYHLDYAASLQKIAGAMAFDELMTWYDAIIQFGRVAQHPLNKRLAMESLLSGYPGR